MRLRPSIDIHMTPASGSDGLEKWSLLRWEASVPVLPQTFSLTAPPDLVQEIRCHLARMQLAIDRFPFQFSFHPHRIEVGTLPTMRLEGLEEGVSLLPLGDRVRFN